MVARKLNQKIRDHLLNATRTGHSLFSAGGSDSGVGGLQRPGQFPPSWDYARRLTNF